MADMGLLGGLAALISNGVSSYRAERDYNTQKQKDAMDLAVKNKLANAQGVDAYSKILGVGGSDAGDQVSGFLGIPNQTQSTPGQPQTYGGVAQDGQFGGLAGQKQDSSFGGLKPGDMTAQPSPRIPSAFDKGLMTNAIEANKTEHETGLHTEFDAKNRRMVQTPTWLTPSAQAKLDSEKFGSRSPNAELTSQYDKQAQPIRGSQIAMNQMLDNYNHPSPQGDASLILNAFKIKFPTAPDVNSLEELSKSQAAPDAWKAMATKHLAGGIDKPTRDNLMRDAVSTFRANTDSLKGIQQRYQDRAKAQGVSDNTITKEPAVDKTLSAAMDLQNNIGPYVPPAQRGGVGGWLTGKAQGLMGIGGDQVAQAKQMSPAGKQLMDFAVQNKNSKDPAIAAKSKQILDHYGIK